MTRDADGWALSRRQHLKLLSGSGLYAGLAGAGLLALPQSALAQNARSLRWLVTPEPPILNTAFNSAHQVQQISSKVLEGLVRYSKDLKPLPALATQWQTADDGLSLTFKLREGVKWHDGKPFTSADVKYSFEEVLKKHHPRGRTTYNNLEAVLTPDAHTVVLKLSKPSAYIMAALSASESPMLPKHLYEGSDPASNRLNNAPVGTGPFKFGEWQRGRFIRLVRNADYWQPGSPKVDALIARFVPDAGARGVALEAGEVDVGGANPVPLADLARMKSNPKLEVSTDGYGMFGAMHYFEFNMRDPLFKDVRVRQAIAHALDLDFITKNIYFGYASPATGPISSRLAAFYTADVPRYELSVKRAEDLLDAAGFPRKEGGVRMKITHDPATYTEQQRRFPEYFKEAMRRIGIDVELRMSDGATFQRRVWTDNSYQTTSYGIFNMSDPTLGVQRMFWSKNIRKGVPFSNGSGYASADMDRILEAAQNEADPKKRVALFHEMQVLAMKELPIIPLVNDYLTTVFNKRLTGLMEDGEGVYGSFANVALG